MSAASTDRLVQGRKARRMRELRKMRKDYRDSHEDLAYELFKTGPPVKASDVKKRSWWKRIAWLCWILRVLHVSGNER